MLKVGWFLCSNVEIADLDTLPESVKDCAEFLASDAIFLTLSNITGLKLHPLATGNEDEEPKAKKTKCTSNGQGTSTGEIGF